MPCSLQARASSSGPVALILKHSSDSFSASATRTKPAALTTAHGWGRPRAAGAAGERRGAGRVDLEPCAGQLRGFGDANEAGGIDDRPWLVTLQRSGDRSR